MNFIYIKKGNFVFSLSMKFTFVVFLKQYLFKNNQWNTVKE